MKLLASAYVYIIVHNLQTRTFSKFLHSIPPDLVFLVVMTHTVSTSNVERPPWQVHVRLFYGNIYRKRPCLQAITNPHTHIHPHGLQWRTSIQSMSMSICEIVYIHVCVHECLIFCIIINVNASGAVMAKWIRPWNINREVPGSNLLAAVVMPLGKALYPHCLVPQKGLKATGPLVAC